MPTLELEERICNWVELRKEEDLAYREHSVIGKTTNPPGKSAGGEVYVGSCPRPRFIHRCERAEYNAVRDVWDLVHTLRMKATAPQAFRKWTDEDLEMFAKEDELDPERAQRLADFLQTE